MVNEKLISFFANKELNYFLYFFNFQSDMLRQAVNPLRAMSTSAVQKKEADLIANAFLKQIRDLANKQK